MDSYCLELRCPDIKSQADVEQIREVLHHSPGFHSVEIDLASHLVVVTTANQDGGIDVVHRLKGAGFPPDDLETIVHAEREQTLKERHSYVM